MGGGISLSSLSVAFKKAKKIQFKFVDVESTSITPFALGVFLAKGSLDLSNPFAAHYFGNDETQEYIIFDVLKSGAINVSAKSETGTEVGADIGALSGALSANVKVKTGSSGTTDITFESPVKATFAFKLFEVLFENGKWVPRGVGASQDLDFAIGDSDEAFGKSVVINPSRLVNVKP